MSAADRVRAALAERSPRERVLLGIAAALLALILLIFGVLGPARDARENAVARHAEAARTLGAVRLATNAPAAPAGTGGPLRAVVSATADQAGIVIDRYDIEDDGVRLFVGSTEAPRLFAWLTGLREQEGITVTEAQVRREEGGMVSARITLRRG